MSRRAHVRLLCFPPAGGVASLFRTWSGDLPGVEVCPLQLPGRESRIRERPLESITAIVQSLQSQLIRNDSIPTVLYGHSMGGLLAYEAARLMRRLGRPPVHLVASAALPPHLRSPYTAIARLDDHAFLDEVRRLGMFPQHAIDSAELTALLLPAFRADFRACDSYIHVPEPPLECSITVIAAEKDPWISPDLMPGWQLHTHHLSIVRLPYGHQLLSEAPAAVIEVIRNVATG